MGKRRRLRIVGGVSNCMSLGVRVYIYKRVSHIFHVGMSFLVFVHDYVL